MDAPLRKLTPVYILSVCKSISFYHRVVATKLEIPQIRIRYENLCLHHRLFFLVSVPVNTCHNIEFENFSSTDNDFMHQGHHIVLLITETSFAHSAMKNYKQKIDCFCNRWKRKNESVLDIKTYFHASGSWVISIIELLFAHPGMKEDKPTK